MPTTLQALLVVAAAVAATLAIRAALGRFLRPDRVRAAQPTASVVMDAAAGLFGILTAFILAGAWDRYDATRGAMSLEANAFSNLRQIAQVLPPPIRGEFGAAVEAYRVSALEEFRLLAGGRTGDDADSIVGHLWLILAGFEPETAGQAELQSRALDAVEELGNERRARLLAVRRAPPPILWLILAGGATAVLGLAALSSVGGRLPAVYLALLAAVISLALYTIYALSYPVRSGLLDETALHIESRFEHPPAHR
ncbi:MAG TPA: hypothetical protein VF212_08845 [Longimicrobiales bacterium]